MSCVFKDTCISYCKECEVKLVLSCGLYHTKQLVKFTNDFIDNFKVKLSTPRLDDFHKASVPVYSYSHQSLYNAVLSEFRDSGKYSYCFKPVSDVVGDAMEGLVPSDSIMIVMADYRKIGDSFATAMTEACFWFAGRKSFYILLPKDFTPPTTWRKV